MAEYHPSTEPDLMWASVREGDLYARLRKLDGGRRWGFDFHDVRSQEAPVLAFDPESRKHRELARELEGYKARLLAAYARLGPDRSLEDAEVRERLRALGYIQ